MGHAPIIGLAGQVCAGKSTVAGRFGALGARIYRADRHVHELYRRADVKREVQALCGPDVFDAKGEIDRKRLGGLVFANPQKLEVLTRKIVFPRTGAIVAREVDAFRTGRGGAPALLLDAPTLFEAGRDKLCDRILFVAAPWERRVRWAREGRGWGAEELARRERHLMAEPEKKARCDAVLENGGSLSDLETRVRELWVEWVAARAP